MNASYLTAMAIVSSVVKKTDVGQYEDAFADLDNLLKEADSVLEEACPAHYDNLSAFVGSCKMSAWSAKTNFIKAADYIVNVFKKSQESGFKDIKSIHREVSVYYSICQSVIKTLTVLATRIDEVCNKGRDNPIYSILVEINDLIDELIIHIRGGYDQMILMVGGV